MKPAPFEYLRAGSVKEAVSALRESNGEGKILAGGQSLVPLLSMRLARPEILVDINHIPGLDQITPLGARYPKDGTAANSINADGGATGFGAVQIGALVRHSVLAAQSYHPLLAEAARWIGHTAIRSRGTLGGSLAHADPAAELPVLVAALDATVNVVSGDGARSLCGSGLFTGTLQTCLAPDEMITSVDLPLPERWGFAEIARRHGDFALVTVVAALLGGSWRVAVGGVGAVPQRAARSEEILNAGSAARAGASPLTAQVVASAAAAAGAAVRPSSDIHASARYRRAMTEELTRRALVSACISQATGEAR